jgi:two-component system, NtrC family, sensor kinase
MGPGRAVIHTWRGPADVKSAGQSMPLSQLLKSSDGELKAELQLILNAIVEGLCGLDVEGNVTFCNDTLLRMTGYRADEIIGSNFHELLHHSRPDGTKYPAEDCALQQAINAHQSIHVMGEFYWQKNGTCFPSECWMHPLIQTLNRTAFVITFQDLSEIQRDKEALRQSEEKFRRILAGVPDIAWTADRQGRTRYVSPKGEAVFGYTKQEMCAGDATVWLSCIHPEDLARVKEAYEALFEKQSAFDQEYRLRRKDGTWIWVYSRSARTHDENGVLCADGVLSDITERKRAEKELYLAHFAIEHASDAIFRVGAQGQIVYVNREACRFSERSREELLALTIPEINPLFPKETWTAFWQEIKSQGSITLETVNQTKNGRIFPVEVTADYLQLDDQEFVFSFVRDITERNALESQLRGSQKLESVGQLAAGIAHEINTPTQFVTDNLTFLRDSWNAIGDLLELYRSAVQNAAEMLPPSVTAALDQAARNCDLEFMAAEVPRAIAQSLDGTRRVAEIVRAMKEFSHPDGAEKTAADLNRAIESTIIVARNEWRYVAEIITEFDATLSPVMCHPGDINQVILNLLVNAAHAIKEKMTEGELGRITVRTRKQDESTEISVTDNGTGIPLAIRSRIFDPFFTTKGVGKGTGQGLALAHNVIVKKHGGKIWFETEIGQGTTFYIHLPLKPANPVKEK